MGTQNERITREQKIDGKQLHNFIISDKKNSRRKKQIQHFVF